MAKKKKINLAWDLLAITPYFSVVLKGIKLSVCKCLVIRLILFSLYYKVPLERSFGHLFKNWVFHQIDYWSLSKTSLFRNKLNYSYFKDEVKKCEVCEHEGNQSEWNAYICLYKMHVYKKINAYTENTRWLGFSLKMRANWSLMWKFAGMQSRVHFPSLLTTSISEFCSIRLFFSCA